MSFIPSFILSTLLFCNASIPGGWDGAVLTEGVICEIPYTRIEVSVDEHPGAQTGSSTDVFFSLKNAGIAFEFNKPGLKLAAGSLSISGTGATSVLSATLPGKTDGGKPLAFFASWKSLALAVTTEVKLESLTAVSTDSSPSPFEEGWSALFNRAIIQFQPGFISVFPKAENKTELKDMLAAGWFRFDETNENSWFLRNPWHAGGNLFFVNNDLTMRMTSAHAKVEAAGTVSFSVPDVLEPAVCGGLSLNLQTDHTETGLSCTVTPASFLTTAGSFPSETLKAAASFAFKTSPAGDAPSADEASTADKATGAAFACKADAAIVNKVPASAASPEKQLLSGSLSMTLEKGNFGAGISVSADKLCIEDNCRDTELTPALELSLSETSLSAKAAFHPFEDYDWDESDIPAWSVKAEHALSDIKATYLAEFDGPVLKKQEFSMTAERESVSISTGVTVKNAALSWNLTFARSW